MEDKNNRYDPEWFAENDSFRRWVLAPTKETILFWESWKADNPEQKEKMDQATVLVLALHKKFGNTLAEDIIEQDLSRLVANANQTSARMQTEFRRPLISIRWLQIAASIVLISGLAFWYLRSLNPKGPREDLALADGQMTEISNSSAVVKTILLDDKTVVSLEGGSSIRFPKQFTGATRRVYLDGEAFFDVTRNPDRPFLVYAGKTVTKVLGTSFRIKASTGGKVLIAVKTGRVSVFSREDFEKLPDKYKPVPGRLTLTKNEQITFNTGESIPQKQSVNDISLIQNKIDNQFMNFEDAPVSDIFTNLGEFYGIEIVFNRDQLKNCRLTTQFNGENLTERLYAVCQAIGATYEMNDGKVLIKSKGCSI